MEVSLPDEPIRVQRWDVVVDIQIGVPDVLVVSTSAVGDVGQVLRWVDQPRAFADPSGRRRATISVPERGFELEKDAPWTATVLLPAGARLLEATDDPAPDVTELGERTLLTWTGVQDPELSWAWDTAGGR